MKRIHFLLLVGLLVASCSQPKEETKTSNIVPELGTNTILLNDNKTTVTWIKDNQGHKLMERSLFPLASDSIIEELSLSEGIPSSISTFLIHNNGKWILFDAGLGADKGGQLIKELEAQGLTPDSIDFIYLTHFHGDHIGGLLQNGAALFTRAKVYASHHEYMAWMMEMSEEQSGLQRKVMNAYRDQTNLFEWGDTLTNGIVALNAAGHTPGHTAFQKGNLLIVGDLMHGAALQMEHPEISGNYDMDKEGAAKSRIRILDKVQNERLIMAGMHLPEPAFITPDQYKADSTGYIVHVGDMAPDFTCKQEDGKEIKLSDLRGKVVMLQFTASWCGVCRKEMPFIERDIWQKHQSDDFYLIGIDRDEPIETVKKVREATGVTYPLALDPSAEIYCKYALRSSGITRNVLIDREGRIVKLTRLYNEEEFASLVKMIDEMLAR